MADEILKDRNGNKIGRIETNGSKQIIRDRNGNQLGTYDSRDNTTRDRNGNSVGKGNLLARFL
jgi:hypothetical protein